MPHLDAFSAQVLSMGQWLLKASLFATVMAALVFAMQLVLGRWLTPAWRYRLWGMVVLCLILPALPPNPLSVANLRWMDHARHAFAWIGGQSHEPFTVAPHSATDSNISVTVTYGAPPAVDTVTRADRTTATIPAAKGQRIDWQMTCAGVWCLVGLYLLGRLIAANVSLARRLERAVPITDPKILDLLDECRRAAGVRRSTPLLVTDAVRVPAAAGVWRARILLPQRLFDELPRDEQRAILVHELAHIRCHDVAINWVLAVLQILHWFNPFIWLTFARLRADRESARDAIVLARLSPKDVSIAADHYARLLIKLTESLTSFPHASATVAGITGIVNPQTRLVPGFLGGRSSLRRRLELIAHLPKASRRRAVVGPVLAFILAGVAVCFGQTKVATPAPQQPANAVVPVAKQDAPVEKPLSGESNEDRAVVAQLDRALPELTFDGVGFADVVDFLRDTSGANIVVDWKSLDAAGVNRNAPVNNKLRNIKFSKVLTVILDDVGNGKVKLGYTIDHGVIEITTADEVAKKVVTRVYDIRDLLVDVPDYSPTTQPMGSGGSVHSTREELVQAILKLVKETVAPDSWKDRGGHGLLRELQGQLIVTQTSENHVALASLLQQLRETHFIQVTVEARFISCDQTLARNLMAEWELTQPATTEPTQGIQAPSTQPAVSGKAFFLNDTQVHELLRSIQNSPDVALIAAPQLTLFNGQRAYVQVSTHHSYISGYTTIGSADGERRYEPVHEICDPGVTIDVQATISADRKYITLTLRPKASVLLGMNDILWPSRPASTHLMIQEPQIKTSELQTTVSVPDSGTVVLGGMEDPGLGSGIDSPARGLPVVGKPRLMFLMVKPTILIKQERPER